MQPIAAAIIKSKQGYVLIEALLAVALFAFMVTTLASAVLYGQQNTAMAGNRVQAVLVADEGLEAARALANVDFANLVVGEHGLVVVDNHWALSGISDVTGMFTRSLLVTNAGAGRQDVTVTVTWQQSATRTGTVTSYSRLTDWAN